eukprot:g6373.t1
MSDFDSDGEGIFSDIDLEEIVSVAEQTEKKREEEKPTNKNAAVIEVFGSDSDEFSDFDDDESFDVEAIDAIENTYQNVSQNKVPSTSNNTSKVDTPRGKWTCTTCTLHNDSFRTKCEACGSSAPKDKVEKKQSAWPIGYTKRSFVEKKKSSKYPRSLSSFGFGVNASTTSNESRRTTTTTSTKRSAPKLSKKQSKLCRDVAENHWTLSLSYPNESSERCPVELNETMARSYVYPTNMQVREYQMEAVKSALFQNTLVVLPTGLGKTFIAAVVMYNYFRWFPEGKIVFMAPTKPLVEQQVEACYKIVGIPPEETAELRGSVPPKKRRELWFQRRVFFCTPQTFANDLQKGTCDSSVVKNIVCVVIDEAHKGTGNY